MRYCAIAVEVDAHDGLSDLPRRHSATLLLPILADQGKVSALEAKLKVEGEYEKYRAIQDRVYEPYFDKEVKRLADGRSTPC